MRILVSGASGLIGTAVTKAASRAGHTTVALTRGNATPGAVRWDPAAGTIEKERLEGFDAVVHLAGENIAAARWSAAQKQRILDSRVRGTQLLCSTLAALKSPPRVLICSSAVGVYGDCGDRLLTEDSPAGNDFLANVCRQWEASTNAASNAGLRVVNLRTGVVLAKEGGALAKMLFPFKMGVGGKIGSGAQYMSWIHLDDQAESVLHCIGRDSLRGPVNSVGPAPATNAEFTKTLGRVLGRPTVFPLPGFAARLILGEMADGLLLASQRVEPRKLAASGYSFRYSNLETALRQILG
jgi:uncharacterized protein (TIGR01777 family)